MEELYKRVFEVRRAQGIKEEFDANESFLWQLQLDLIRADANPEWMYNSRKDNERIGLGPDKEQYFLMVTPEDDFDCEGDTAEECVVRAWLKVFENE